MGAALDSLHLLLCIWQVCHFLNIWLVQLKKIWQTSKCLFFYQNLPLFQVVYLFGWFFTIWIEKSCTVVPWLHPYMSTTLRKLQRKIFGEKNYFVSNFCLQIQHAVLSNRFRYFQIISDQHQLLIFDENYVKSNTFCLFLDAIASPSSYPCQ